MSIIERTYEAFQRDENTFFFESKGWHGTFPLIARFEPKIISLKDRKISTYNFGYACIFMDENNRYAFDDEILIGNGDHYKIFRTVARLIRDFIYTNPSVVVYLEGSTLDRTFTYNLLISRYASQILDEVDIDILTSDFESTIPFKKDSEADVIGFLITKRIR